MKEQKERNVMIVDNLENSSNKFNPNDYLLTDFYKIVYMPLIKQSYCISSPNYSSLNILIDSTSKQFHFMQHFPNFKKSNLF